MIFCILYEYVICTCKLFVAIKSSLFDVDDGGNNSYDNYMRNV